MIAAPPVALAVSPPRLVVAAAETRAIRVTNTGATPAAVVATATGYAVTLRGRPVAVADRPPLTLRPRRLVIPPGRTATLAVSAGAAPGARDRAALVLLAEGGSARGVRVSLRIGVLVIVRGAGRAVHHLVVAALRRRGRTLAVVLRNAGDVSERVAPAVQLERRGRRAGVLRASPRELLPHARGLWTFRVPRGLHGRVIARVRVAATGRAFPLRLP